MLIDKRKLKIKAGDGGRGAVDFEKMGKPCGGRGGKGGDIYIEGTNSLYDLKFFKRDEQIKAENGENGMGNKKDGRDGTDVIIKVPLVTHIFDGEGNKIFSITEKGQRELIAKGGRGGWGNLRFKAGQKFTLDKFEFGKPGEEMEINIELNLSADIIFLGFPNAGKSSMLNALTNANAKVAPYPFTTLEPHLGVTGDLVLMDLPGFIEGTMEGKGLGPRFIKHMIGTKAVAHLISLENEDVVDTYKRMRAELKNMSEELIEKPEIIVLTKSDLYDEKYINTKVKEISRLNPDITITSAYNYDQVKLLEEKFKKLSKEFNKK